MCAHADERLVRGKALRVARWITSNNKDQLCFFQ